MSDLLDLDALLPKSATIKFEGETITVEPPKTADVLRLGYLGEKIKDAGANPEAANLDGMIEDLTNQIGKCIPQLQGKSLAMGQLLALSQLIAEMAMPPDSKELKKRGITVDGPKEPSA